MVSFRNLLYVYKRNWSDDKSLTKWPAQLDLIAMLERYRTHRVVVSNVEDLKPEENVIAHAWYTGKAPKTRTVLGTALGLRSWEVFRIKCTWEKIRDNFKTWCEGTTTVSRSIFQLLLSVLAMRKIRFERKFSKTAFLFQYNEKRRSWIWKRVEGPDSPVVCHARSHIDDITDALITVEDAKDTGDSVWSGFGWKSKLSQAKHWKSVERPYITIQNWKSATWEMCVEVQILLELQHNSNIWLAVGRLSKKASLMTDITKFKESQKLRAINKEGL